MSRRIFTVDRAATAEGWGMTLEAPHGGHRSRWQRALDNPGSLPSIDEGRAQRTENPEDARDCIISTLREGPDGERGWDRLAYLEAARLVSEDSAFDPVERVDAEEYLHKEVDRLREEQLDNGGWVGSEKTSAGGLLQTAMVLDVLTRGELGLGDESVERGLDFMLRRLDELFGASWGGVLIQSLAIFAGALLRVGLIR
jgi:hypothetical protein